MSQDFKSPSVQSAQREDVVQTIKAAAESGQNRVKIINRILRVAIPPKFVGDELTAAKAYFDDHGYKYINELAGYLIHYENLDKVSSYGQIRDDHPCIYHYFKGDFYVFEPVIGDRCIGKIIKLGKAGEVICNVLECVSVSITVPDPLPPRFRPFIKLDLNLYFEITSINEFTLTMRGVINDECLRLMEEEAGIVPEKEEEITSHELVT